MRLVSHALDTTRGKVCEALESLEWHCVVVANQARASFRMHGRSSVKGIIHGINLSVPWFIPLAKAIGCPPGEDLTGHW